MPVFTNPEKTKFKLGADVITPLGMGQVVNVGETPLGPIYRVKTVGSNRTNDFFENQLIKAGDFTYTARSKSGITT